jgi:hypothetical protein
MLKIGAILYLFEQGVNLEQLGDRKKAGEIVEEPSYQEDRNGFA